MKLEGEYAVDKKQRWHRGLSLAALVILFLAIWHLRSLPYAIRAACGMCLPMVCIWFPHVMSRYNGFVIGRGRHIDQPSHPIFLRWAGWFLLLAVLFWVIFLGFSQ